MVEQIRFFRTLRGSLLRLLSPQSKEPSKAADSEEPTPKYRSRAPGAARCRLWLAWRDGSAAARRLHRHRQPPRVLGQYAKGLAHHNPLEATALQDRLERIQWRLWHGDADEALTRVRELAEDVAVLTSGYPSLARLVKATAGLATDIGNNVAAIADYAERWDHGEIISTAFAEATVDLVVSRRFAKKQPMQWSKKGAHRLLQTRTRTLDGTLHDLFTSWYPAMPANDVQPIPLAAAA